MFKASHLNVIKTNSPKIKPNFDSLVFGKEFTDHMIKIDWTTEQGWSQPSIIPFNDIKLSPASASLHYSIQVFEGMKAYLDSNKNIRLFRPIENMKRLINSCERMCLPTFESQELLNCIEKLISLEKNWIPDKENSSLYIRPLVIGTETSLGVKVSKTASILVMCSPVGPYFSSGSFKPVSLLADPSFIRAWPGGSGDCKAGSNYGPCIQAQRIAESMKCTQVLWLYNKQITEVGTMNIFVYWINSNGEKELITPPLNGLILPGITRDSIIRLVSAQKIARIVERTFTIDELLEKISNNKVLEIFGSGTACVVCPVNKILYQQKWYEIPFTDQDGFLSRIIHQKLTDIQYGKTSHEWSHIIKS